jgi:ABC-type glycerol-3-phosphate transport system permease component
MYISGMRVVFTILTQITFSAMFAFLMTREKMKFRKFVYRYAIITMYVGGGLIPWYIIMRAYGLFNNFAVYIIPYMFSAFYVILIKTYIESIPSDLEEAARIDGAGFITTFFQIILPLCKPILATCALFTAVGTWNMFFDNFLMVTDPNLQTVQIELFNFIREAESIARTMRQMAASGVQNREFLESLRDRMSVDGVRNVTTIVSMLPIMIVYPFLQKYFTKGIMLGAVKG